MFVYPKPALLGRIVPKAKIYQFASANAATKELFVNQVDSIVWQYKLAPETIHLPATDFVTEIQIFDITLKGSEFDLNVLKCIDAAIPSNIFYRVFKGDYMQFIGAFKRYSEIVSENITVDAYFSSDWFSKNATFEPLPFSLNLQNLYEQMLQPLLSISFRENESLLCKIERLNDLQKKRLEHQKIESRLAKEKQFNRKVELNAQLRVLKNAIMLLET